MDMDDFSRRLGQKAQALARLQARALPVKVGRMAKDFFQEHFRLGGWRDGGLRRWQPARRQLVGGKGASAQYGPLLSGRNHLRSSISYVPGAGRVRVFTTVPYAPVHNYGGTVSTHPRVTPRMRRYAWARFFAAGGGKGRQAPEEAAKWRALALTRKQRLTVRARIPQRKFMGESRELSKAVRDMAANEVRKLINA